MYKQIEFIIKGVAPLIMHNGALSDPLNEFAKAMAPINAKKNKDKTDADREQVARLEWFGGIYKNEDGRVVIPGVNLEGCIRDGGMKERLGPKFKAGLICEGDYPLEYEGPKDINKLWENGKFRDTRRVGLKGSSIQRTRPIFRNWSLKFVANYLDEVLTKDQVVNATTVAGRLVGICDYTPRFGRFEIVETKVLS